MTFFAILVAITTLFGQTESSTFKIRPAKTVASFLTEWRRNHTVQAGFVDMGKIIINSPKYGRFIVKVDDEDVHRLSKFNWHICLHVCTGTFYAVKNPSKICPHHSMARYLLNAPKGTEIDHIDLDKLNNHKSNLRLSTHIENNRNKRNQSNNRSGFKGVHWRNDKNKFETYIWFNKVKIHGAYFTDIIKAAKNYNKMAIKFHGKFARLNQIPNENSRR